MKLHRSDRRGDSCVAPTLLLIISLFAAAGPIESEPKIRQVYPSQTVFLGHPTFCVIQLKHPIWESYSLKANAADGVEISTVSRTIKEMNGEVLSTYRLRMVADKLVVGGIPSVLITDKKGQSIVLNGKPLIVKTISGASLDIKEAQVPQFLRRITKSRFIVFATIVILICALLTAIWKYHYRQNPKRILLRELKQALLETEKGLINPFQLWNHLRSSFLWREATGAQTAGEFHELTKSDIRLSIIADGIESLEKLRFSGQPVEAAKDGIIQSIKAAIEILERKSLEPSISK